MTEPTGSAVPDPARLLGDLVQRESGIVVRDAQLPSLTATLQRIDPETSAAAVVAEARRSHRALIVERLAEALTVNETFFLRHADELEHLRWRELAARAKAAGRKTVRVWSAGCATGEEAYTLAMLATEGLSRDLRLDVLGTDLSMEALGRARRGVYRDRSMDLVDEERRARWFVHARDGARVGAELRNLVRLRRHNLVRDPMPPEGEEPFDVVVCRNVLIYFDAPTSAQVIAGLRETLHPDGVLLLGTADRLSELRGEAAVRDRAEALAPAPARAPVRSAGAASRAGTGAEPGAVAVPTAPAPRPVSEAPVVPAPPDGAAEQLFERGVEVLASEGPAAAIPLLRRALYLDPRLVVAALQLARAHDLDGDVTAARRAYRRTLALAERPGVEVPPAYDTIDLGDVADACRRRLAVLSDGRAE